MRIFPFSIRVSLPIFLLISELPFCCFRSEMWEVSGLVPLTLEKEPPKSLQCKYSFYLCQPLGSGAEGLREGACAPRLPAALDLF